MTRPFRWLGLDSSLAAFGWCVAELEHHEAPVRVVGAGCIRTEQDTGAEIKAADVQRRMHDIGLEVLGIVDRYAPALAAIESAIILPGGSAAITVSRLGRVFGLIDGLCLARGLPLSEVHPQTLKRFVTGSPKAEKSEVLRTMLANWPSLAAHVEAVPKALRDNVTDAAALCRYEEQRARQMVREWRGRVA